MAFGTIAHLLHTARQKTPQEALLERGGIDLVAPLGIKDSIAKTPLAK